MANLPATPAFYVDATGPKCPTMADIVAWMQNLFRTTYGQDINLDPSTQDGGLINTLSVALLDAAQASLAVYNCMSPATAFGAGLSSIVKINNITRLDATQSRAPFRVLGQFGTLIQGGVMGDDLGLGTRWALPDLVEIPQSGQVDVEIKCTQVGAFLVPPGRINKILQGATPGWQGGSNLTVTIPGAPVETDDQLRLRQSRSVASGSVSTVEATYSAVANVQGVGRVKVYQNDKAYADANGIPGHNIAVVVEGGDPLDIAKAIAGTKDGGGGTFGTIFETVPDSRGNPDDIYFSPLELVPLTIEIDIRKFSGYQNSTDAKIKDEVIRVTNALQIGDDSYITRMDGAANLENVALAATYVVVEVRQARDGNPPAHADVLLSYIEAAVTNAGLITINTVA